MQYLPLLSLAVFAVFAFVLHRQLGPHRLAALIVAPAGCALSWAALHYSVANPIFASVDPQQAFASVENIMDESTENLWLARYLAWYFGTLPGLLIYTAAWIVGCNAYHQRQASKSSNGSDSPTTA